ncbi:hypothetical protein ELH42_37765 [Rhizobium ruizarguesonis]|uniref:hypothetical protein n=1 Tax=Rhizobium ruizarguesonis TaxID=2081791 RepID=UPI0010304530|nr:hypothetical protein [Rhizobium ruizarguesonis]TBB57027.1 hypothetical protein ELH42_37765 [Rhizobium ruizarguesonis]
MFWEDLPKSGTLRAELPVFHTTESLFLRDIVTGLQINTTKCKVYDEDLVYVFYGRPSYRPSSSNNATKMLEYYPVVFLMSPDAVKSIKRMLPFDSGGYHSGRFEDFLHPAMRKEQFEIPPPIDNLEAVISYFFGSPDDYMKAVGKADQTPAPTRFEIAAFHRMVHGVQKSTSDDRRITCEVQSDSPITLTKGVVRTIIAPSVFEDEDYFTERLIELGCAFKGYDCDLANSNEMHAHISYLVREAIAEWKAT